MRYVIKKPAQGYFTEFAVSKTTAIFAPMDMIIHVNSPAVKKGEQIGVETEYAPVFNAFLPGQAAQFDTEQDAQNVLDKNPAEFGGVTIFADCVIEPNG